ncbi:chemotaxis MotB protein [Vibrio nigripulchritudo ATCC 27043]|uniref:OmpA/MotB family protein n=1 Tax=Vibrio nigripulchritudo TaxID=28173 RepID=UPI00021C314F|nr:flagellar motor protein MotB [Vibrio nigripulchritudo]EGU58654.1 chemotaxis MotB protein [Vibrio nigripulchritudo ATCC 27043]
MPRRRHNDADVREDNDWLVTYSDFITLLMTFFIVILATSQIDQGKFEDFKAGWNALTQRDVPLPMNDLLKSLESATEQEPITLTQVPDGIKVDFDTEALYQQGSADLSEEGIRLLGIFANSLKQVDISGKEVVVEGHTDDVPIQNEKFDSNWELSGARAIGVARHLISLSVDRNKVSAVAFADTYPQSTETDSIEEQRKQNRRVSIYIRRSSRH